MNNRGFFGIAEVWVLAIISIASISAMAYVGKATGWSADRTRGNSQHCEAGYSQDGLGVCVPGATVAVR